MSEKELSLIQHEQAVKLHNRIMASATLAQQSLWDMCKNLKEMRDSKLYKALGYANFEDYCENEVGFNRKQAHKYISIVEKVNLENVHLSGQIGVTKLALLATVSESEQQEISEKVNLEETTVKQLKAEIDKLKQENKAYADRYSNVIKENNKLKNTCLEVASERKRLEKENEELRNRPIDVAVVDNSAENDRKLNEVIRSLECENIRRNEEMDRQYIEDRRQLEADKQREINAIRDEYEKKLAESVKAAEPSPEPIDADKLKFKVYLTAAFDSLKRLTDFTQKNQDDTYKEKIKQLLNSVLAELED